jgi:hypothetical protein
MTSSYVLVFSTKILHQHKNVLWDWEHAFRVNVMNLVVMQNVLQNLNKVLGNVFQTLIPKIDVFVSIEVEDSY